MLSIKRLLSATAAAAIAVAGLAIGAAPANAQGTLVTDEAQFMFTASAESRLNDHKLEYVKIGDYIQYGNTQGGTEYGVRVNSALKAKSPNLITAALNDALKDSTITQQVPSDVDDPLAWALSKKLLDRKDDAPWDGVTRKFATYLVNYMNELPTPGTATLKNATAQGATDSYGAYIELPAGIYLFRDVTSPVVEDSSNAVPMLVGSGTVNDAGQLTNPTSEALIKMKNYSTKMSFSVVGGDTKVDSTGRTASRGETLTYTMNGYVPKTDEVTSDNLDYVNTPQKGLKVDLSSIKVTIVDKDGKAVTATSASDYRVLPSDGPNVTTEGGKKWFTADGTGDSSTGMTGHTITVRFTKDSLAKWQNYIGSGYSMQVSYDALVTADADSQVDNEFYMTTLPDKKKYAHSVLAKLTFQKVDAAGNPLPGARFRIESADPNQLVLPSGYVNANTNRDASCGNNEAISNVNGTVTFDGLAQNPNVAYKITEVSAPSGYITLGLSFTVTISNQGEKVVFGDSPTSDPYGLVTPTDAGTDSSNSLTVENVHSIAQLPLTGGAGIAFMVVIAALLGTAGVIVVVRSRRNTTV